jgi:hypothetical protein
MDQFTYKLTYSLREGHACKVKLVLVLEFFEWKMEIKFDELMENRRLGGLSVSYQYKLQYFIHILYRFEVKIEAGEFVYDEHN